MHGQGGTSDRGHRVAAAEPDRQPPQAALARLMDGYLTTQLLYTAATLGIADALGDDARSADEVAAQVGARPQVLYRLLRGLAAEGVLEEDTQGRFALSPLGECLRAGVPGSMHGAVLARGDVYYGATAGLVEVARDAGVAFEHVHGMPFFDYLAEHPDWALAFQGSMADRSRLEAFDVVAAYDFSRFHHLVDVGGGYGILLAAILAAAPRLHGVLFDQPAAIEGARSRSELAEAATGRYEAVAGDFFVAVPPGGDVYLLSRVIHDWDDESAVRILASCRAAMERSATLLLVEAVLPELARDCPEAIRMDLHMLALLGGRERTLAQYERLLAEADFRITRVVPTQSRFGLSVIEAAPVA
jgi:hypothetical protein